MRCPADRPHGPACCASRAGTGTAIETEVWALAPDAFGRFVAGIPAPLGIGTLRLADGTGPKGFLVEAEGVAGAKDIACYGGWRGFLARDPG